MQKCRLLSFFWTSTTALHHALWLEWVVPKSNISHKCAQTSSTNGGGICLNHSLNGMSSVTLITFGWLGTAKLTGFQRKKMSWYSAKRDQAELTSSGGQDSNPLTSNFSNNFSCLCSMVSLCGWMPWASSNASIITGLICGSSTSLAATTLATGTFLLKPEGMLCYFSLWWWCSCCHCTSPQTFCTVRPWGNGSSSAHRAWVITFNLAPVNAVFALVCMILDEKASTISLSLMVTISSYSTGSNTLVATLSSPTVVMACLTARR